MVWFHEIGVWHQVFLFFFKKEARIFGVVCSLLEYNNGVFGNSSCSDCVTVPLGSILLESITRPLLFPCSDLSLPGIVSFAAISSWHVSFGFWWIWWISLLFCFGGFLYRFMNGMWWDWGKNCSLKRGSKLTRDG